MSTNPKAAVWNEGVKGDQVLPLINSDENAIRVEAGPGTGKTFGLVRRVERILHPDGLHIDGSEVLVVAFNRVIAKQLRTEVDDRLNESKFDGKRPVILTVHGLCLETLEHQVRLLLAHEQEAMVYDILTTDPDLQEECGGFDNAAQMLRDHEAGHAKHPRLWTSVMKWLLRHKAKLISDLPGYILDSIKGGDYSGKTFSHVIVDEFQDLTQNEQELVLRLLKPGGYLVVLGDPRQSIYFFRGNDVDGLSKLEQIYSGKITDYPLTECQRCPEQIVTAANQLMIDHSAKPMLPGSAVQANTYVLHWNSPKSEAVGMAKIIFENFKIYPHEKHLVMATRRQFGYWVRAELLKLDDQLNIEMCFSEAQLESWAARESFLMFCLICDPDPATWRAWLGYQNSQDGKDYKAPKRNSEAYLKLLSDSKDNITDSIVISFAANPPKRGDGAGAKTMRARAQRFADLKGHFDTFLEDPNVFVENIFGSEQWITPQTFDPELATTELALLKSNTIDIISEVRMKNPELPASELLKEVAGRIRGQIATREPFIGDGAAQIQIATLHSAKGVTANHVYVLGLCDEAIPGERRSNYSGTDIEYIEEQQRLFYVTLTRSKNTLVLSRAKYIQMGLARDLGLQITSQTGYTGTLHMSRFLRQIISFLPDSVSGEGLNGALPYHIQR